MITVVTISAIYVVLVIIGFIFVKNKERGYPTLGPRDVWNRVSAWRMIRRRNLSLLIWQPIIVLITFFLVSIAIIAQIILLSILKPLSAIVKKLEGEDKILKMLVTWGIGSFIVGNLLQLISTF